MTQQECDNCDKCDVGFAEEWFLWRFVTEEVDAPEEVGEVEADDNDLEDVAGVAVFLVTDLQNWIHSDSIRQS